MITENMAILYKGTLPEALRQTKDRYYGNQWYGGRTRPAIQRNEPLPGDFTGPESEGLHHGHPPVQAGAIPCFKDWKDVIAKAPTGSGKTFAFGIPMVEHTDPEGTEVTGLILAPTRELALQIQDEIRQLCAFLPGIRVACLYGGQPIDRQINQLKKHPQIVVATPGRLMDHMKRRTIRLHKVETVVLDEADRMLDMGFIKDVTRILKQIPHRRNLGMFSATISREVMDISWVYQRDPVEIVVRPVQENRPQIQQYRIKVDQGARWTCSSPFWRRNSWTGSSSSATPRTPPTGSPACSR